MLDNFDIDFIKFKIILRKYLKTLKILSNYYKISPLSRKITLYTLYYPYGRGQQ